MLFLEKTLKALFIILLLSDSVFSQETTRVSIEGLDKPVEILKDRWGISHIYAETEHDLFLSLIHI